MREQLAELFLGRQPILNHDQAIVGYELLFRAGPENRAEVACERQATAEVVVAAFAELGIANALGTRWGVINVDAEFVCDDAVELLPKNQVVLELAAAELAEPLVLGRCRELRKRGYAVSVSGIGEFDESARALVGAVDIVRIDAGAIDAPAQAGLVGSLARLPIKLLADRVESQEAMQRCRALGFRLFQGFYFAKPAVIHGRKLDPSLATIVQIINMLSEDADIGAIEAAFKHQPALTINLLRLSNSVGVGLAARVSSVRHALNLLGRRQLQRWLQLLLIAGPGESADVGGNALMQLAALRGRMLELLASRRYIGNRNLADMAFLAGILSVMPAALGLPMVEILAQIAVAPEVRRALARGEGEVGQLVQLIDRYDANDIDGCAALLAQIGGLSQTALNTCLTDALAWVQQLGQEPRC